MMSTLGQARLHSRVFSDVAAVILEEVRNVQRDLFFGAQVPSKPLNKGESVVFSSHCGPTFADRSAAERCSSLP